MEAAIQEPADWRAVLDGSARATVITGDCLQVMREMPDRCVDLVLTDPPYAVSEPGSVVWGPKGNRRTLDFFPGDTDWRSMIHDLVLPAVRETLRLLKPHGSAYWWCSHRQISLIAQVYEDAGYSTRFLAWHKTTPPPIPPGTGWSSAVELCLYAYPQGRTWNGPHAGIVPNLIVSATIRHGNHSKTGHPTQKPWACFQQFVEYSSNPGDLILDLFLGSGTSGVVSVLEGRRFIGIEIEPEYSDIARRRIFPRGDLL